MVGRACSVDELQSNRPRSCVTVACGEASAGLFFREAREGAQGETRDGAGSPRRRGDFRLAAPNGAEDLRTLWIDVDSHQRRHKPRKDVATEGVGAAFPGPSSPRRCGSDPWLFFNACCRDKKVSQRHRLHHEVRVSRLLRPRQPHSNFGGSRLWYVWCRSCVSLVIGS